MRFIVKSTYMGDWYWYARGKTGRAEARSPKVFKTKSGARKALNRFIYGVVSGWEILGEKP